MTTADAQELDWQNAPKADCVKAHQILEYLSASVMDYDYLVRIVGAALAAERETCAAIADAYPADAWGHTEEESAAEAIATLIRARSKPPQTGTHPAK